MNEANNGVYNHPNRMAPCNNIQTFTAAALMVIVLVLIAWICFGIQYVYIYTVSYTHLTLPTNREV